MTAALTAAGLVVALGGLALIVACWKTRTVLGGVLGAAGMALAVFGVARGASGAASEYSIAIAAVTLTIGTALYIIGQALERLLGDEPDEAP
jgi:membrane-bound ClpP family serine protease